MSSKPKKNVVVIGGGYAGVRSVEELSRYNDIAVTLIDKNRFHYLQAEIHEFIAGKTRLEEIAVNLEEYCDSFRHPVAFLRTTVLGIDFDKKEVHTESGNVSYDYLMIATGAVTFFPGAIQGIKEHTKEIKGLAGALYYKQQFEAFLFRQLSGDEQKKFSVIVGGAGLSGVEIAAEMAHRARRLGYHKEEVSVTLVEPLETVLPGMDPFLIEKTKKRLEELEVACVHGSFISKITDDAVELSDGTTLPQDIFIFTGGVAAAQPEEGDKFRRNRRNQLLVDKYLRLPEVENVFVVGDAGEIHDRKGEYMPPTSQIAKQTARCAAENIARSIGNVRPMPCDAKVKGVMVALGGTYAAGTLFGKIRLSGLPAYFLKKLIFFLHGLSIGK